MWYRNPIELLQLYEITAPSIDPSEEGKKKKRQGDRNAKTVSDLFQWQKIISNKFILFLIGDRRKKKGNLEPIIILITLLILANLIFILY